MHFFFYKSILCTAFEKFEATVIDNQGKSLSRKFEEFLEGNAIFVTYQKSIINDIIISTTESHNVSLDFNSKV